MKKAFEKNVNFLTKFLTKRNDNYFLKKIFIDKFIYSKVIEVDNYVYKFYRHG